MRFTVKRGDLDSALTSAIHFVPSKPAIPVQGHFLFEVKGETLEVSASNGIQYFRTRLSVQDAEDGKVLVPTRRLADLVRRLSDESVLFVMDDTGFSLKCGKTKSTINVSNDDFVAFPVVDGKANFTCPGDELKRILKRAAVTAAKTEGTNNNFAGVYVDAGIDGCSLEIAATDTYRLAFIQAKIAPAEQFDPLFIPISTVEGMLRVLGKSPVEVAWDTKSIVFKSPTFTLSALRASSKRPAFKNLFDARCIARAEVDCAEVARAVDRASLFEDTTSGQPALVNLYLRADGLEMTAEAKGVGSFHEVIAADGDGSEARMTFKCQNLYEALGGDKKVKLLFTEGFLNVKFKDDRATFQTVLLPVLPLDEAEEWKAKHKAAPAVEEPCEQADSAA